MSSYVADSRPMRSYEFLFNLLLIGDSTVGKTSVLSCYATGRLWNLVDMTIGGYAYGDER